MTLIKHINNYKKAIVLSLTKRALQRNYSLFLCKTYNVIYSFLSMVFFVGFIKKRNSHYTPPVRIITYNIKAAYSK